MNRWLVSKEIKRIREDQQKLVEKFDVGKLLQRIENPMIKTAAAQVLQNQFFQLIESDNSYWEKIKYGMIINLFKRFESEIYSWTTSDVTWPENANLAGLRDDNRVVVLEEGKEIVWTVSPVEKQINTISLNAECMQDIRSVNGLDVFTELASVIAGDIATKIVKEVKGDLKLYCKNNILEYNYCIHSFRLEPDLIDKDSFVPSTPLIMKYVKTATFGD